MIVSPQEKKQFVLFLIEEDGTFISVLAGDHILHFLYQSNNQDKGRLLYFWWVHLKLIGFADSPQGF